MRRARALALACAGGCLVVACSGGASASKAQESTAAPTTRPQVTAAQTTSIAPTTPAAPTTAAGVQTGVALIPQESPDLAANAFLAAWRKGDRRAALVVGVPAAVNAMFMLPAQDYSDRSCQTPISSMASCAFGIGDQAAIAQIVTVSLDGGWVVQSVAVNGNT